MAGPDHGHGARGLTGQATCTHQMLQKRADLWCEAETVCLRHPIGSPDHGHEVRGLPAVLPGEGRGAAPLVVIKGSEEGRKKGSTS